MQPSRHSLFRMNLKRECLFVFPFFAGKSAGRQDFPGKAAEEDGVLPAASGRAFSSVRRTVSSSEPAGAASFGKLYLLFVCSTIALMPA